MKQRMITRARQCNILLLTGFLFLCSVMNTLAVGENEKTYFPQETLIQRIQKIEQLKNVKIAFDENMVRSVSVPALTVDKSTAAETLLEQSLTSSNLTYKKYGEDNYAIVRKIEADGSSAAPGNVKTRGSIAGTVLDEKQVPIVGVTVLIPGTTTGTATNADGKYRLQSIAAGTVAVRFSFLSYETLEVKDVKINPGKTTALDVVMKESSEELNEVIVTANYKQASAEGMYAKQKAIAAMSDGISAEQIKKTSDNNVAQVLKRVSGVTLESGKFVNVRGMGERYNNVELNGSSLPSTEPNRRNFSFDIIPSNLVDNVTIAKTFTPDMPGEFTGGMVQVNTLAIPKERIFSLSVGSGFNTNSTGKDFIGGKRLDGDYFLGDSDERDWFGRDWINDTYFTYFGEDGYLNPGDAEKAYVMNAKIPNHWGMYKYEGAPLQNYALTAARPFDLGKDNQLGVVLSATYRHEETTETVEEANYRKPDQRVRDAHNYTFVTAVGIIANIGWERPGHKVTWSNLYNNRFTQSNVYRMIAQQSDINDPYISAMWLEQYSSPLRGQLWQTRLEGGHKLLADRLALDWFADYNKVRRGQHDDRLMKGEVALSQIPYTDENGIPRSYTEIIYLENGDPVVYDWGVFHEPSIGNVHVMYNDLEESKKNGGGNLTYGFDVLGNRQVLKTGYQGTIRESDYAQQYLRPKLGSNTSDHGASFNGMTPEETFAPETFADGSLVYWFDGSKGIKVDYYHGEQTVHAGYLMGELTFLKKLHLIGGVRLEDTKTEVTSLVTYTSGTVDTTVTRDYTDWLPALTAVWNITPMLNLRSAYGKTLARPEFRELTQFNYWNVADRVTIVGMDALNPTYTDNVDVRMEWYPAPGEVLSLSAFYKKFKDPAELLTYNPQGAGNFTSFAFNLDKSTAKGLELNLRKSLGFMAPGSFLDRLYLSGNATVLKGDVSYNLDRLITIASGLDPDGNYAADRNRPLQGMANYLLNAGLSYEGRLVGLTANYSTNGRKLVQAAPEEWNDEYEAPCDMLDLQLLVRMLNQRLEFKANASNLLNQAAIIYINSDGHGVDGTNDMDYNKGEDLIRSKIKRGTSYSFSVSYHF
ncbi:MAG: TonB-dependent receptor domain-containing protein [Mangrovibacterium sp.]